ncbi:MAG: SCP2 sterol-binding domain-containing protein [Capsulimonadaceae bacterium]
MASVDEVRDSLVSFARSCNENEKLGLMNKDWNRTIGIHATDFGVDFTLATADGRVSLADGKPAAADMLIRADADVLTAVFYGEVSPNEPYNEGTLRVQGSEQDILHLDFITAMLWA